MGFTYEILHTGSKGNFNLITHTDIMGDKIVIATDAGLPFKHIEKYLFDVDVLLYSHVHADHYAPATYHQIRTQFPNIIVITNDDVARRMKETNQMPPDYLLNATEGIQIGDIYIKAFENEHGTEDKPVDCTGWILYDGHENILYSTDMTTTIHYRMYLDKHNIKLDTILLEANYDLDVVGFIENMKLHTGFDIFNNGSERHMSLQEFHEFCELYKRDDKVKCVPLHMSETYFSFDGMRKQSKFEHVTDEQIERYLNGQA